MLPDGRGRLRSRRCKRRRGAFTDGTFSIRWASASSSNAVATHRHQAAATKVPMADRMYRNTDKI
jgi:hypothetical protein